MTQTDGELLARSRHDDWQTAFAELTRRHAPLVYAAALRQLGRAELAEDVTQAVFLVLWQKAAALRGQSSLGGWLLTVTRHAAIDIMRKENRQHRHEQAAAGQRCESAGGVASAAAEWEHMAPVLDQALARLRAADRDALVLRYFQDLSLGEVGKRLEISEEAARKRVTRALERLRELLAASGVTASTAALAATLPAHALVAPPATLAASLASIPQAAAGTLVYSIAKGVTKMMAWAKLKVAMVVVACVAGPLSLAPVVAQHIAATTPAAPATVRPVQTPKVAGNQVLVELHMLALPDDKIPANIKQMLPPNTPKKPLYLSLAQREELLKATAKAGGEVLAAPTLVLQSGTEAEIKDVELRRYVKSVEPGKETDAEGHRPYRAEVADLEQGLNFKVRADVSDTHTIKLSLVPRLTTVLQLERFSFTNVELNDSLAIQRPRTQEIEVETVLVPDGSTLVFGGFALTPSTGKVEKTSATLVMLVRAVVLPSWSPVSQLTVQDGRPTPIAVQAKVLTISEPIGKDVGRALALPDGVPYLDDARMESLTRAVQGENGTSVVTSPRLTIEPSQPPAHAEVLTKTSYVANLLPNSRGGFIGYVPVTEEAEAGFTFKASASAVGPGEVRVSAEIAIKSLISLEPFTFVSKPLALTLQEPALQLLSAKVDTAIPDKHWLLLGPLPLEGDKEGDKTKPSLAKLPILHHLLTSGRGQRVQVYLLLRPEISPPSPAAGPAGSR